jgi:hypothetical protein
MSDPTTAEVLLPPTTTPLDDEPVRSRRPAVAVLAALLGIGVLVDLWWNTPLAGTAALLAATGTVTLLVTGPVRTPSGRLLVVLALGPAAFLALRTSPWVVAVDVVGVLALLACGGALGRRGSLLDLGFGQLARAVAPTPFVIATTPPPVASLPLLVRLPAGDRARRAAIARGALLAVPVALVIAVFLASGDAVFASMFSLSVDPSGLAPHLMAVVVGSWLAAGLLAQGERGPLRARSAPWFRLGAIEATVVLGALIGVYGLFALARLLVVLRGAEYVVQTTGLTYAEYARSGFFQLLWAAALTLVVLVGLRSAVELHSDRSRRAFAVLSLVAVALTLVMVHSAVVRLDLYADAFGLTMLRLCCTIFAWWLAGVFVLTGLSLAGVARNRSWLPGAVVLSAVVTLLVFNLVDPEALVVEHNVGRVPMQADDRMFGEDDVDLEYLTSLSDDAVPALVAALPTLSAEEQDLVRDRLCPRPGSSDADVDWNVSSQRAADARAQLCG